MAKSYEILATSLIGAKNFEGAAYGDIVKQIDSFELT